MRPRAPRLLPLALAVALAAPASGHLLQRGTPLSELSVSSPVVVIGQVKSVAEQTVELVVAEAVLGSPPPGPLRFGAQGHHPPEYELGSMVLVFLASSAAPWVSRQTALDRVVLGGDPAERDALRRAVRAYAGLRGLADPQARLASLKQLSLDHLEAPSSRVRHEALLDLVAISSRVPFGEADVARLVELARSPATPEVLAPGLVVLLAAIRSPEADRALFAVLETAGSSQARARAARVIGVRRGSGAELALRDALEDPAPVVRATAEHALARFTPDVASESTPANPMEGTHDAATQAAPN